MLGEFTPWHSNGKMHCHLRPVGLSATSVNGNNPARIAGSIVRREGTSGARTTVDSCALGRMWRDSGEVEGGPHNPDPPPVLRGWGALMYNERAKCHAATLTPRLVWKQRTFWPPPCASREHMGPHRDTST